MKRALAAVVVALSSTAGALTLNGSVVGELPSASRVGAWTVSTSGAPINEIASAALNGARFSLRLPEAAPSGRALWPLMADHLAWPGVTGDVTVAPAGQGGEAKLFVYGDANGNGRRDEGEAMSEATVQAGKANVVVVYSERDTTISASRGLQVKLATGWNAVLVEPGRTLRASVARDLNDARLVVTR